MIVFGDPPTHFPNLRKLARMPMGDDDLNRVCIGEFNAIVGRRVFKIARNRHQPLRLRSDAEPWILVQEVVEPKRVAAVR